MRFGLITNLKRADALEAIETFIHWSKKSKNQLFFCDDLREISSDGLQFVSRQEIVSQVDVLVSMGGDGTVLSAVRTVGAQGTPVLGINIGSLGFLTQLTPQQLPSALDAIVKGEYQIEKRMLLKAEAERMNEVESPYALNDIVIDNGPISRLIDINLKVNGEDIVTYKADGLVIATPTGSTAYSLAVGGPIMHPKMEGMIAAPISSFSLNTRPMVFSPEDILEVKINSAHYQAGLTLDGQVMLPLKDSDIVVIKRADFYTNFIVFPNNSFYKILRNKLHWGYPPSVT